MYVYLGPHAIQWKKKNIYSRHENSITSIKLEEKNALIAVTTHHEMAVRVYNVYIHYFMQST